MFNIYDVNLVIHYFINLLYHFIHSLHHHQILIFICCSHTSPFVIFNQTKIVYIIFCTFSEIYFSLTNLSKNCLKSNIFQPIPIIFNCIYSDFLLIDAFYAFIIMNLFFKSTVRIS